ncbi:MAG: CBS domain-containing protein [Desulfobulbaceae bacterium]|nr:CBS domain-containing protein [Desulfobulbaceae bacterium]
MQLAVTHKGVDFDALSSIVAATLVYPGMVALCPKSLQPNVQHFLALHKTAFKLVRELQIEPAAVRRLAICDCNQWKLLEDGAILKECSQAEIDLWDHHEQQGDIVPTWSCVEPVGATITLLLRVIQERKIAVNPHEATLFLLGLYEDTGQLTFDRTTSEDLRSAAFLLDQGGDLKLVVDFLHVAYSEEQKKVLYRLMRGARQYQVNGRRVGIGIVRVEQHVKLAAVVQLYARIIDADAVFVVFENSSGSFFIIGRSKEPGIDVRVILQDFDGGGHPGAGSALVPEGAANAAAIREQILTALYRESGAGPLVSEMMSSPVTSITADTPLHEAESLMEEKGIRGLVVEEDGQLAGVVVLWDLKKLTLHKQQNHPVKAFMQRNVLTIAPDATVREAAHLMVHKNIGHLPVVAGRKVVGIITRTDVVKYLYGMI